MKTRVIKSIVSLLLILMVTVASLATATAVGSKYYYYDLMFYTAGSSGISQDYIYMQIHGEKGSTDWEKLSCCGFYRRYGSVSLGDFNDVGKVTGVSVKNECIDGWYPEKIEVISPSKEKTTIYCAGWVDNNDEVRFDINKNILEVNVKTSSALFSGTDADVWAIFYDENGVATEGHNLSDIYPTDNAFERGDDATMYISAPDNFGKVKSARFYLDDEEALAIEGPAWRAQSVKVTQVSGTNNGFSVYKALNTEIDLYDTLSFDFY